jgi:transglutaminase-like putative cysteine protease
VLTVALYRAAGLPGYVVGGWLGGEAHSWTAVFVHDPDSRKWHEIFIDPTSPFNHGIQPRIWGYYHYDYA